MDRHAYYGQSTTTASGTDWEPPGPTLGEISAQIERRLAWYGPSVMMLDAVYLKGGETVIVHLRDVANTVYREVIDVRLGRIVKGEVLQSVFAGA